MELFLDDFEGVVRVLEDGDLINNFNRQLKICRVLMDNDANPSLIKGELPFLQAPNVMEFNEIVEHPYIYILDTKENKLHKCEILSYDSVDLKIFINDIDTTNLSMMRVRNILTNHLPSHL